MKKKLALLLLLALVLSIFSVVSWASTNSCEHWDVAEYSRNVWKNVGARHQKWVYHQDECRLCGEIIYYSYATNIYGDHVIKDGECLLCEYPEMSIQ